MIIFSLDGYNVGGLKTLRAILNRKFDALAFLKGTKAFALNCRKVDKHIGAILSLNKAVAFAGIEPLDRSSYTFAHFVLLIADEQIN
jgi:hypothetical protein